MSRFKPNKGKGIEKLTDLLNKLKESKDDWDKKKESIDEIQEILNQFKEAGNAGDIRKGIDAINDWYRHWGLELPEEIGIEINPITKTFEKTVDFAEVVTEGYKRYKNLRNGGLDHNQAKKDDFLKGWKESQIESFKELYDQMHPEGLEVPEEWMEDESLGEWIRDNLSMIPRILELDIETSPEGHIPIKTDFTVKIHWAGEVNFPGKVRYSLGSIDSPGGYSREQPLPERQNPITIIAPGFHHQTDQRYTTKPFKIELFHEGNVYIGQETEVLRFFNPDATEIDFKITGAQVVPRKLNINQDSGALGVEWEGTFQIPITMVLQPATGWTSPDWFNMTQQREQIPLGDTTTSHTFPNKITPRTNSQASDTTIQLEAFLIDSNDPPRTTETFHFSYEAKWEEKLAPFSIKQVTILPYDENDKDVARVYAKHPKDMLISYEGNPKFPINVRYVPNPEWERIRRPPWFTAIRRTDWIDSPPPDGEIHCERFFQTLGEYQNKELKVEYDLTITDDNGVEVKYYRSILHTADWRRPPKLQ